jgi:hypothetical protein
LEEDIKRWELTKRDDGALLRGVRLVEAEEKLKQYGEVVTAGERAFIGASVALREREKREKEEQLERERLALQQAKENAEKLAKEQQQRAEEQTKTASKLKKWAWSLAGVMLVAIISALFAVQFGVKAEKQRNEALTNQSLFLADLSRQQLEKGRAVDAMLLALEGLPKSLVNLDRPYVAEAHKALQDAIDTPHELKTLVHEGSVRTVAFNREGTLVVTASSDNTVRLWEVSSGRLLQILAGHEDRVNSAAFSPDGH